MQLVVGENIDGAGTRRMDAGGPPRPAGPQKYVKAARKVEARQTSVRFGLLIIFAEADLARFCGHQCARFSR
ncbi:hypothetical protein ASU33_13155 [Solirubrum puertoriconensis]|uniref:Uncharacterized protein n=1 Tax=Solirubrum puertoriconensis TaxID=1751427 RepID=A0A9X0HJW6_SOLP1|nr:hypothetical protein ASU33_13155 [Solirubrum puertoriconensis]